MFLSDHRAESPGSILETGMPLRDGEGGVSFPQVYRGCIVQYIQTYSRYKIFPYLGMALSKRNIFKCPDGMSHSSFTEVPLFSLVHYGMRIEESSDILFWVLCRF